MEVLKNSLKGVCGLQIKFAFGKVGFNGRGKPEYLEKSLSDSGKGENQQQTQLMYYGINAGVQTWATLVAGTTFTPQQKPFFSFSVPHLVQRRGKL